MFAPARLWAAFPGEHLSVFNRKNIRLLFETHKFEFIVSESESVKSEPVLMV